MDTIEQLNRIEVLLSHQDRQIQDLSEMVSCQWTEIERLKARLEKTLAKLESLEDAAAAPGQDGGLSVSAIAARDKPPHY